ncbi:alanine--glyoxylate aminotransferase 2, mitochondrial [Tribolium castaneum]|uniref:alanine--glyoxylate aminotransferase 2, mitochondrial n=1 Tax=Tribolium castaneum TaxID=7070 RepID=UPI00046C17B9|nr:PREDICTED: alanine--glyoxylate aminotransferase 2, mitochondrial [Tribolium castaneum]|eukprot:XP_969816.2 PREDICTED: alanine--glyoxylate aminotransferase 2, mitochondrial [Tribolium castaneum]
MIQLSLNKIMKCSTILRMYSSMPKCDFVPQKYTGPSFETMSEIRKTRLNPALTTYYGSPLAFHQGHMQWLFDINGRRYLDMFGGICTVSVGHSHPKITEALHKQIQKLTHVSNVYFHPKIHEYAVRLTEKFPGNLKVVYFVNSGSEANDLAVLMARSYTKNFDIVTLKNAYHGMTYQTMGLTSNTGYKYKVPQAPGIHNIMNPDVYRGLWGGTHCRDSPIQTSRSCSCSVENCEAKDKYLEQLRDIFKYNVRPGGLAAFFAESIQGVGGTVQFPKGYIKGAYKLVKEHGGLFISDEVQTGFGRTGEHFWGFEMHGIEPDIVTMAKSMGNGFPLAAVVTRPEIAQALASSMHFNTFGGNPLACTVGITVLDIIEEEQLQKNCLEIGTYFLKEMEKLKAKHSIIGDVRGKGLMLGVELVEDDKNASPLDSKRFMKMWEKTRDMGLIIGKGGLFGNVIRIKPPMCITKNDADYTVHVLDKAFEEIK